VKVLVISNLYPPLFIGGYEKLCESVVDRLRLREMDIKVLTSTYKVGSPRIDGHVFRLLTLLVHSDEQIYMPHHFSSAELQAVNSRNIQYLEELFNDFNPDCIMVWNFFFFDRSLFEVVLAKARTVVLFLTDTWLKTILPTHQSSIGLHHAIFSSQYMLDLHGKSGYRFKHYEVIHNGVDFRGISPREKWQENDPVRLLFAGRVVEFKGCHILIDALKYLLQDYDRKRIKLTILGDTSDVTYVEELKKKISKLRLESYVEFQNPVPPEQLDRVFKAHDFFIFPSLHEPFSLILPLAMASGIPVVGSYCCGNKDILVDGRNCLSYAPFNSQALAKQVRKLLQNPKLASTLAKNAMQDARKFSIDIMVEKLESFLVRAVHSG